MIQERGTTTGFLPDILHPLSPQVPWNRPVSAPATVNKILQMGNFRHTYLFLTVLELKSKIIAPLVLVPDKAFLACRWAPFGVSSYNNANSIRSGHHPHDPINIDYFFAPDIGHTVGG